MMHAKITILLQLGAMIAAAGLATAQFAPPSDGPVAFRRDKIPLDADAISGLSKQLEILARDLTTETATDRRGAAQMLALSLALDPANASARELITAYKENRHHPQTDGDQLEKSRARIWQLIGWLETSESGSQGRALADCLKDVIVIADPKHPKAEALRAAGEHGAWAQWIPNTSAYEEAKPVAVTTTPRTNPLPPKTPSNNDSPKLDHARIHTVLWKNDGTTESPKWINATAPLEMTVKSADGQEGGQPARFGVKIGAGSDWDMFAKTNATIQHLLINEHGKLPSGFEVIITSKELGQSLLSKKKQSISAAAAVLASAAITGQDPDAIVLGQIDDSGTYRLSSGFWNQIKSLSKSRGRKLVLPTEAAALLPSMLAMENPGFFMEYEVVLASNFKQLLALTTKTPNESNRAIEEKFQKIREHSSGQEIRQYIANRFVRQRLAEIAQEAPYHLSAKLLLIQSEGKRPTLVTRKVLAAEVRTALEPMNWISSRPEEELNASSIAKLATTYESCRTALEELERYADKADKELLDQSRNVVVLIRSLDRTSRTRGEPYIIREAIKSARGEFIRRAKELTDMLARETDDTPVP